MNTESLIKNIHKFESDIEGLNSSLETKASKDTTIDLQNQVNNLVLNGDGTQNLEVVQARSDIFGNGFSTLKDNLDNIQNVVFNNIYKISFGDWIYGPILTDGTTTTDNRYIHNNTLYSFSQLTYISIVNGYSYRISKYNQDGSYITSTGFISTPTVMTNDGFKYKFTIYKDSSTILDLTHSNVLNIKTYKSKKYDENGATFINTSLNLIDNKNLILNSIVDSNTGLVTPNTQYCCTDFIPFTFKQTLFTSKRRSFVIYDINKNVLSKNTDETFDKTSIQYTSDTVSNMAYIRLNFRISEKDLAMASYTDFVNKDEYGLFIEKLRINSKNLSNEFDIYLNNKLQSISNSLGNPLIGKKILNLGDSISAGDGNNGIGIAEIIATSNNMTCLDYALGGATIGEVIAGGNNIVTQLNKIIADNVTGVDYITFNGGTNDINGGSVVPLGNITQYYGSSLDLTTFCGAFEHICKTLKNKYIGAKILYFRVHKMNTRDMSLQTQYGDKAIEICKKWSIPVVDLFNEGGLNTNIDVMKTTFTNNGDGTHPNDLGYKTYYQKPIETKLKSI